MDANTMAAIARDVLDMPEKSAKVEDEAHRSFFGAPIGVIATLWNKLLPHIDVAAGAKPKHLLWALVMIKVYTSAAVHRRIVGWPDPKTYRKWSWYFLEKIALLKEDIIQLDRRFEGYDGVAQCLMSIDGVDCMVNEPWPFDTKWYSQKFNGPGVKYEVGVCIATGNICWINGPFVASREDSSIFADTLADLLASDEGVEVDAGYKGHPKLKAPTVATSSVHRKQKSQVRGRHENVNSRLKIFNVLVVPFRHLNTRKGRTMMQEHGVCFDAVAVVTQLKFDAGDSRLYGVNYDVTYY